MDDPLLIVHLTFSAPERSSCATRYTVEGAFFCIRAPDAVGDPADRRCGQTADGPRAARRSTITGRSLRRPRSLVRSAGILLRHLSQLSDSAHTCPPSTCCTTCTTRRLAISLQPAVHTSVLGSPTLARRAALARPADDHACSPFLFSNARSADQLLLRPTLVADDQRAPSSCRTSFCTVFDGLAVFRLFVSFDRH